MACNVHSDHGHKHGEGCGHTSIRHGDHNDYLHDNHMHHVHGDHVDDHSLSVSGENNADCTPDHSCGEHDGSHKHGSGCGHQGVPHGDHIDYIVNGHLHSPHNGHCDDHGRVSVS